MDTGIAYAVIDVLDDFACRKLLSLLAADTAMVSLPGQISYSWLLAHCFDGVTWGIWDENAFQWKTANRVFPEISPEIRDDNLIEMRIFGKEGEILIWKADGKLCGRLLKDNADEVNGNKKYLLPLEETWLLLGNRLLEGAREGFSRVGSPTGAEQVVPFCLTKDDFIDGTRVVKDDQWPLYLLVKHYLQQDLETGVVRIAATRLVEIANKKGVV